jgi:hypothetical protein
MPARRKGKLSSGSNALTGYGPFVPGNRPVRTRMPGGVGAGGEKPPATRLAIEYNLYVYKLSWLFKIFY